MRKKERFPDFFFMHAVRPAAVMSWNIFPGFFCYSIFYNPNISPKEEYEKRVAEIRRLISEMEFLHPVDLVEGAYRPEDFMPWQRLEDVPEGGERCFKCYRLRMEAAAKLAQEGGYDYFTTTLSISPLKNAGKINEIGQELAQIYKVEHLRLISRKRTDISGL